MAIYPKGTVVAFESGEYSDFGYVGHFVTVQDCDFYSLAEEYKKSFVPKNDRDQPDYYGFTAWLVITERCFPATVSTLHIGCYGELKVEQ